jgi:hypothetical protein
MVLKIFAVSSRNKKTVDKIWEEFADSVSSLTFFVSEIKVRER